MQQYLNIENSIIGMLLYDASCINKLDGVVPEDFSNRAARAVFESIKARADSGGVRDPAFIVSDLEKLGYTEADAVSYIMGCIELTSTSAEIDAYVTALKSASQARKLGEIADKINDGILINSDWKTLANEALEGIEALDRTEGKAISLAEGLVNWCTHYQEVKASPDKAYCRTYYSQLDNLLGGGLYNGGMYILAARPGMGKTTLALNLANRIAQRRPVLFVSLEMSEIQIISKILSICSGVGYTKLMTGKASEEEFARTMRFCTKLSEQKLRITDKSDITVDDICALAKSIEGLGCIAIDYLGLVPMPQDMTVRDAVTVTSKNLKAAAKRLNLPVIVLCQLNRDSTQRAGHKATMADLRDSGAIEQDADGVILLHREGYYQDAQERPEREEIELIVDKNRHGQTGKVKMLWNGATGQITEIDSRYQEECFGNA